MTAPSLIAVDFPTRYESRRVSVGGREVILTLTVPIGHVGFLSQLAFNNPSDSAETEVEWWIDNSLYKRENQPFGEDLTLIPPGSLPRVKKFEPPIVFRFNMFWYGLNNSQVARVFEVAVDGAFYEKPRSSA